LRSTIWLSAFGIVFLLAASPVIASPLIADHATGEPVGGINWLIVIIGLIASGGFLGFLRGQPGWLSRTGHPRPISPPRMFTVVAWQWIVAPALVMIVAASLLPEPGEGKPTLRELATHTLVVQSVMLPLVVLWFGLGRTNAEKTWVSHAMMRIASGGGSACSRSMSPLKAVGAGVIGLLVCWPAVMGVGEVSGLVSEYYTGQQPPIIAHKTLDTFASADRSDPWLAVMIAAVVLVAPLLEEVVYRGAVQGCLRGLVRSPWPAIVLSALLFGSLHIGTAAGVAIPGLIVFGFGLGIVYERTGTLLAPLVMHSFFNAGNIALLLALKEPV
jgi:membrane protease YdiL (CAAX protease family)